MNNTQKNHKMKKSVNRTVLALECAIVFWIVLALGTYALQLTILTQIGLLSGVAILIYMLGMAYAIAWNEIDKRYE